MVCAMLRPRSVRCMNRYQRLAARVHGLEAVCLECRGGGGRSLIVAATVAIVFLFASAPAAGQQATSQLWLVIFAPTQVYWPSDDPAWIAQPGEWYQVLRLETGWALAVWELDSSYGPVWIETTAGVQLSRVALGRQRLPRSAQRRAPQRHRCRLFPQHPFNRQCASRAMSTGTASPTVAAESARRASRGISVGTASLTAVAESARRPCPLAPH